MSKANRDYLPAPVWHVTTRWKWAGFNRVGGDKGECAISITMMDKGSFGLLGLDQVK